MGTIELVRKVIEVVGPASVLAATVAYSRPHIAYWKTRSSVDGLDEVHVWIKNFEPIDICRTLLLSVKGPVKVCDVLAGPWFEDAVVTSGSVELKFKGLPGDGSVGIRVLLDKDAALECSIAKRSPLRPRSFGAVEPWTLLVMTRSAMARAVVGSLLSYLVYTVLLYDVAPRFGELTPEWAGMDTGVVVGLTVLSILGYTVAVGVSGKSIACGFLEARRVVGSGR
jgi:hypothetical protein